MVPISPIIILVPHALYREWTLVAALDFGLARILSGDYANALCPVCEKPSRALKEELERNVS